jgi:cellulose synthase/poly-beta-1,6-N-acetylglucosamine synthase-like glycosyltransferase
MICGQNNTSFSWSYRDSSKRSLGNNVKSRRGKRKIHTLEIGGNVQMAKSDPEAQRKSSLSDCTWLENEYGSFNLETLKFLMYFSKPRSSLYFYFYTYSYFFLFLILIFFSFSHHFFLFFFLIKIFLFAPLEL